MNKWKELVKEIMREQNVTQTELAERVGVSQGAVGHWMRGRSTPHVSKMNRVLRELGMDNLEVVQILRTAEQRADYEAHADDLSRATDHDRDALHRTVLYFCYPRLTWAVAGTDQPSRAAYYRGDAGVSGYEAVGPAYWLKVEGDAMNSPVGVSVPDGTEVLVDPGLEAQVGDLTIARRPGIDQAILRQLAAEGSERFLKPLNPTYPVYELSADCLVVGVVVQAMLQMV